MPRKMDLPPDLVERITALFDAGQSRRKIGTALQQEGYAVPTRRYKTWHHSLVSECLVQLGLVSPPSWTLKPGVLGEGAKRWEAMLKAERASPRPSPGPATSPEPVNAGSEKPPQSSPSPPAVQPAAPGGPPTPAGNTAPTSDLDAVAERWEHALASASTLPAEATPAGATQPQPSGANDLPQPPPLPAAASVPASSGPPSLNVTVDGPCTPPDRRLWFSLVRVARPELGQRPSHELPRAHALALLATGPPAPGPADLWEAMKRLRASGITWEAWFEGRPLLITTPLISGVLRTTVLTFHFSPELVTLLLDGTQFARLRALLGREHDPPPSIR